MPECCLISSMHEVSVSSDFLISSSPSLSFSHSSSTSSSSCYPSTSPSLSIKSPMHFAKEMGSTDESFSNPSEPKDYEPSSIRSPWPSNGSPSNGSSRTWITTMPQSVRCSSMYTENKSVTPSEKACLLVSHRRPCPIERGNPLLKQVKRQNSEHAQIRTLLDRQREQILEDCQTEIKKHEFQADHDRRIHKLSETIESQQEELNRVPAEELHGRDQQLLHEQVLKQNWDLREAHEIKSQWSGRIEAISRLNIRHNCEEKIDRRSRYYPWTHWQNTGITEWNQLYERFERFSRCWISTQWTLPRCQSTSVFPTSSRS